MRAWTKRTATHAEETVIAVSEIITRRISFLASCTLYWLELGREPMNAAVGSWLG
jgi:hypothetical protein